MANAATLPHNNDPQLPSNVELFQKYPDRTFSVFQENIILKSYIISYISRVQVRINCASLMNVPQGSIILRLVTPLFVCMFMLRCGHSKLVICHLVSSKL